MACLPEHPPASWRRRLLACGALLAAPAWPFDLDLPGLQGAYDTGQVPPEQGMGTRHLTFTLPDDQGTIVGLRVSLSGTYQGGWYECWQWGEGPLDGGYFFSLDCPEVTQAILYAQLEAPPLSFDDLSESLQVMFGPLDLNDLAGHEVDAAITVDCTVMLPECWVTLDATGQLTEVRLEVETATATGQRGWGDVKASFR